MKCLLTATTFAFSLLCSPASAQTVTYKYLGGGCGPTSSYIWFDGSDMVFRGIDTTANRWICSNSQPAGTFFVVLSAPSNTLTPLPSYLAPCLLRGTISIILSTRFFSTAGDLKLGRVPAGVDVYVQGVFILRTSSPGRTCPQYLSVTPAWHVKR